MVLRTPFVTVADFFDKGMLKIADSLVWFSKNPTAASRIMVAMVGAAVLRSFSSTNPYERDFESLKKQAVDEPMVSLSLGAGVLLVLIYSRSTWPFT